MCVLAAEEELFATMYVFRLKYLYHNSDWEMYIECDAIYSGKMKCRIAIANKW